MSIHDVCEQARHASCACGAYEDQPCTCGPRGVHYSRVARACRAGYISLSEFGDAIHDDVFRGLDVLIDPAEVTA